MTDSASQIRDVYARRDATKGDRYAWYQRDVINQEVARNTAVRTLLHRAFGGDLSAVDVLDVGCGNGAMLRGLIELGVPPEKCTGIDFLPDRIEDAVSRSHVSMHWQVGGLETIDSDRRFALVTAWTVLSSVPGADERRSLLDALWERVRPGGWLQVFDFRFNNPRNPDVRRVRKCDFCELEPVPTEGIQRSLITPPPLARWLCRAHPRLDSLLSTVLPAVRSHQFYMLRRGV